MRADVRVDRGVSKYGAKKSLVDGISFASKAEASRYLELKALERAGRIRDLVLQPRFLLIPSKRRPDGVLERACHYVADFGYVGADGERVIEDTKGFATPDYIIKRKLMLDRLGIAVQEVRRK